MCQTKFHLAFPICAKNHLWKANKMKVLRVDFSGFDTIKNLALEILRIPIKTSFTLNLYIGNQKILYALNYAFEITAREKSSS